MFMQDIARIKATPVRTASAPVLTGLLGDTLVETAAGWHPASRLRMGDRVQTLDGGAARILGLDRQWITPDGSAHTLRLPGGLVDNCADLTVLPDQHLLIDTAGDPAFPDDLFVLLPARAFDGLPGVTRRPLTRPTEVLTPLFGTEEAVYAQTGALLHCPGIAEGAGARPQSGFFTTLNLLQARLFLTTWLRQRAA